MKRHGIVFFVLVVITLPLLGVETGITYRFDRVRNKVALTANGAESRASNGTIAHDGDRVRTGWFAYAMLAAPRYAARFEIFSGTDVVLAGGTPGMILSLEKGRLEAIFEKITGSEPRMVRTPGALLAVRGTRYGVEVGRSGQSDLAVFEGTVEVRSPLAKEPILVHAGEACHYGTSTSPVVMPMPHGMNESMWRSGGMGTNGMMTDSRDGDGMPGGMSGSRGGSNPPMGGSGHHGH